MDTFFEQIVAIKKGGTEILKLLGIWLLALILIFVLLFVNIPVVSSFSLLFIAGIIYGAFKLTTMLNVEYEYIITNGILDIDKIVNKSSRKRMLSLDLAKTSRIDKFNPSLLTNVNQKSVFYACNADDSNAYLIVIDSENGSGNYLVFAPDDRIKGAIVKFVPKFIANSAFK